MTARDRVTLSEISERCRMIHEFTATGKEAFLGSRLAQEATIRCFEVIGEATRRLPDSLKRSWPKVPWEDMSELRNVLIHEYDRIDPEEVWRAIVEKLPVIEKTVGRVRG
jgi:uncharacterized protein with HEPN domain